MHLRIINPQCQHSSSIASRISPHPATACPVLNLVKIIVTRANTRVEFSPPLHQDSAEARRSWPAPIAIGATPTSRLTCCTSFASILPNEVQQVKRSEEHTSELQSPDHLVCRLLLEKKKKHLKYSLSGPSCNIL